MKRNNFIYVKRIVCDGYDIYKLTSYRKDKNNVCYNIKSNNKRSETRHNKENFIRHYPFLVPSLEEIIKEGKKQVLFYYF